MVDYSKWVCFFFSSRRRHTRYWRDWSSDVCSSDLGDVGVHPTIVKPLPDRRQYLFVQSTSSPGILVATLSTTPTRERVSLIGIIESAEVVRSMCPALTLAARQDTL